MGFLAKPEVVECSATDLIGQFVGQTGPKTTNLLRSALGKVLFIDEAYRLGEGHFATEAVNELVDCITKTEFANKLIVVLAGYDDDMDKLMNVNRGLSSRFPAEVVFENMTPDNCYRLLRQGLLKGKIDLEVTPDQGVPVEIAELFNKLSKLKSWANGRDVNTLAKALTATVFAAADNLSDSLIATTAQIMDALTNMLSERQQRESAAISNMFHSGLPVQHIDPGHATPTVLSTNTTTRSELQGPQQKPSDEPLTRCGVEQSTHAERDPGVPDEVWDQLQRSKADKELLEKHNRQAMQERRKAAKNARAEERAQEEILRAHAEQIEKAASDEEAVEAKRLHEQARLKSVRAKAAREKAEAELEAARTVAAEARKKEVAVQKKLKVMGICPMGFRWIKQSGGYRCSAGGHFVKDVQLGL